MSFVSLIFSLKRGVSIVNVDGEVAQNTRLKITKDDVFRDIFRIIW